MPKPVEPSDYLNAHQRARDNGFRVVTVVVGPTGRGRAVFRKWMEAQGRPSDFITVSETDYRTAQRVLERAAAGSALEFVPAAGQLMPAMAIGLTFAKDQPGRPVAIISHVAPIEAAIADRSADIGLQQAIIGGLVPLTRGIAAQVDPVIRKPKAPEGYRSVHEYVLHMLIQHDRAITAQFLANRRVAGGSRRSYEIDLWCERLRLAIEIDGAQHFAPRQRQLDEARDADLAAAGIKTQRILAGAVMSDPSKALVLVRQTVDSRVMEVRG
jgi:very-short-patch-repair endonuclease